MSDTEEIRYILTEDNDGHYYVIPSDMHNTWWDLLESGNEFVEDLEWVDRIGGAPSLVTFSEYRIERF